MSATKDESLTTGAPEAWTRVQLARQPQRPHALDYIAALCGNFVELHGDRAFSDDAAIVGGLARLNSAGRTVMVIGHQKGANTKENVRRHFGMAHPEGFRKARRLMRQAEKFGLPLITFVDIPGADPGIESEERGQAIAIAECIQTLTELRVPIIATVIGEGGSGGALALGVADEVIMLENAIYSVISPEGCASILWNDAKLAPAAAAAMRVTAADALAFGIADRIVPEPAPAHEDPHAAIAAAGRAIRDALARLTKRYPQDNPRALDALLDARYAKFRQIGCWNEEVAPGANIF
ncbi:MAG TPA: acetyl-CoA carboxylase carboxyltransferase subunit alpha [Thermomicrobiales bacterium]|nr:acetyl-CoA carboxylase carboxyltransferase subunit alpha [Thermomicrobiales bacterium]